MKGNRVYMSGQTLSERILSRAAKREVKAGEFIMADIDCAMIHDITGPLAVKGFYEIAGRDARVWDPAKIVLLFDHQVPADSLKAAENHIQLRKFAAEQGILNYDIFCGVCHQVMPEKGHVLPGDVIVGTDSHTCTYGALGAFATGVGSTDMASVFATGKLWFMVPRTLQIMIQGRLPTRVTSKDAILRIIGDIGADGANYLACEFRGEAAERMSIPERMTVSNMAIEMGAKVGIFPADQTTRNYLQERVQDRGAIEAGIIEGDEDASFSRREWDVSDLEPQIAMPHNVDNVLPISQVPEVRIDQVFLGSCTNGRFEDLQLASEMMRGEPLAKGVRMIVVPASREEYLKCLRAGLVESFMEAGAMVESPCCGPCMGGSFGLLGAGEHCLATSNRNFVGRQGSPQAFVYLSSPATAGASAITGYITDPREI
ncbi:MAG TPA: 3-isopropylmalate dehydratase large subunit [Methanothrix sp.]|jgi:3-isopropylmalate/(R)-2-methylmalate dehydratase large subunit|uniref:3-isopropylmalate dehydratase large subunit n=1 Tax=Methanothrix sp. TaxID=90426 RepID=UPI002BE78A28|nr:3-isopropylmalate dehydratase large subunit [Methanothrix sp.]MDI9416190.1 3-isopropylmalate dehydratase large subunit [Euryarchaeota archaeon]HON36573.1 3-isopropylmalate dehydratase large subunit [Methanothrix sp.]HRU76339.1 3-isopropylmalate dehydratase large subunit [Methanothrix sp.]